MAQPTYRFDEWGNPIRGGKPSNNIALHNQTDFDSGGHGSYGRINNNYEDNHFPASSPPAYGDSHQAPAPTRNMARGRERYSTPWYRKKRVWAAVALVVLIAIVVPVAVVVTRNKEHANSYPDYTALNYTLLDTCKYSHGCYPLGDL